jgi:DNA-binding MarR family transcriptional regulator
MMKAMLQPSKAYNTSILATLDVRPHEERILRALLRHHYLTAEQIRRRHYGNTLSTVQANLKRMVDKGLVKPRLHRPRYPAHATYVYHLTRKGLNYLQSIGTDVPAAFQPIRRLAPTDPFMAHTLAVNDVLLSAELLDERIPQVEVRSLLAEHDLKKRGTHVKFLEDGGRRPVTVAVIPDLALDLALSRSDGRYREYFVWEVDRGSEEQKRWKTKVRAYLLWSYPPFPYREALGDVPLTAIAVLAVSGEGRHDNLLRWTEEVVRELPERQRADAADLFRVSWGNPAELSPEDLFLAPRWRRPLDRAAMPLLAFEMPDTR